MAVRKLKKSWQFDFTLQGFGRQRRAGYRTKAEALEAERQRRKDLVMGRKRIQMKDAYTMYMSATAMKARSRDHYEHCWRTIEPVIGHFYIEEVTTSLIDSLVSALPDHLGATSINHRLALVRVVLRFMWTREYLAAVPYIPTRKTVELQHEWYSEAERDRLLDGIFETCPEWYAFFYLTTRLGLRRGEVYAISRDRVREVPPQLVIDRAVQEGKGDRPALLVPRKNNRVLTLALTDDLVDAIRWHVRQGYAGPDFLFSQDGRFHKRVNAHTRPLRAVQQALGLRALPHHKIGRHSVASQAVTSGHSIKAIQAQLGHSSEASTHQYAHLGSRAQLRLVRDLTPVAPPHGNVRSTSDHGDINQNLQHTETKEGISKHK